MKAHDTFTLTLYEAGDGFLISSPLQGAERG